VPELSGPQGSSFERLPVYRVPQAAQDGSAGADPRSSHVKPTFDHIFKLTGTHLAAATLGFMLAVLLFAPRPRVRHEDPLASEVLELRTQARAAASASAGAALDRAVALCQKRRWPACDPASVRKMGSLP